MYVSVSRPEIRPEPGAASVRQGFPAVGAVFLPVLLLSVLLLAAPAFAAEKHHDAHEHDAHEHGAHEHGVSKLKLAIEDAGLEIELVSPGADIVGFEHAPSTDADSKAIASAAAVLRKADALFVMPASAGCRVVSVDVESPSAEEHEGEKHHAHDDAHKGADEARHSEFHAHYVFKCQSPEKLTHIDTRFFERFPAAREIEAVAITPTGQIARELTRDAARLQL